MSFSNVYDDAKRAEAYARLEFPGTYYLAYRDLPAIIAEHVTGHKALDFGCGAGRSTRFLENLGFEAIGIDISPSMIHLAEKADPAGNMYWSMMATSAHLSIAVSILFCLHSLLITSRVCPGGVNCSLACGVC